MIEEAVRSLVVSYPELSYAVMLVNVKEGTPTRTDGKTIYIDPEDLKDRKRAVFMLVHELMHIALQHPWRIREINANPVIANLAADVFANYYAWRLTRLMPRDAAVKITGESSFSVEIGGMKIEVQLRKRIEEYTLEELIDELEKFARKNGTGLEEYEGDDKHDSFEEADETDRVTIADEVGKKIMEATKTRGIESAEMKQVVKVRRRRVPVAVRIKGWVKKTLGYEIIDWKRPGKRSAAAGVYLPRWRGKEREVNAVVDVSGSMWNSIGKAIGALQGALLSAGVRRVKVFFGDVEVKKVITVRTEELREIEVEGGGGTVLRPVIEEAAKDRKPLIVVTDGYVDPEDFEGHSVPILVLSTGIPIRVRDRNVEVVVIGTEG